MGDNHHLPPLELSLTKATRLYIRCFNFPHRYILLLQHPHLPKSRSTCFQPSLSFNSRSLKLLILKVYVGFLITVGGREADCLGCTSNVYYPIT